MGRQILGRQPVVWVAVIQSVLATAVSFGWLAGVGLRGPEDVALVGGVLNGAAAVYLAYGTVETALAPAIELFKAVVGFAAIYGLDLSAEQSAFAIATITAVFAAIHQPKTAPQAGLALDTRKTAVLASPVRR
jgi:hypothetical protein